MANDFFLDDIADTTQDKASVAALPDGDFVAVWDQYNEDVGPVGSFDIESGVYNPDGTLITAYQADTGQQGDDQSRGQIAALSDGNWVVAWNSDGGVDIQNVFLQQFAVVNGVVTQIGPEVQISPTRTGSSGNPYYDQYLNNVVALPDGGYRVVYVGSDVSDDWTVYEQQFNAAGQNAGGETVINTDVSTGVAEPDVLDTPGYQLLPLADGGFVAAYWQMPATYPLGDQIWLQLYDANAGAVGNPVLVSAPGDTYNNQYPSISALANGDFAVTWTRTNPPQDAQSSDAEVRVFDANENPVSGIETINSVTGQQDASGQVVALPNGDFLATYVAFNDYTFPDDYYLAEGRLYNASGQPLTGDFTISQYSYIDMTNLEAKALADGDIAVTWTAGNPGFTNVYETILSPTDIPTLCFLEGTRIATPSGQRPVESLAIGDMVLTLAGPARCIVWIGKGRVLATRGRRNAATPIVVRKGALTGNVPDRDLRITKGHALYLDDVLIPVEFLVNHRSIRWDDHAQEVSLYHIEFEIARRRTGEWGARRELSRRRQPLVVPERQQRPRSAVQAALCAATHRRARGRCGMAQGARPRRSARSVAADRRPRCPSAGGRQALRCNQSTKRHAGVSACPASRFGPCPLACRGAAGTRPRTRSASARRRPAQHRRRDAVTATHDTGGCSHVGRRFSCV